MPGCCTGYSARTAPPRPIRVWSGRRRIGRRQSGVESAAGCLAAEPCRARRQSRAGPAAGAVCGHRVPAPDGTPWSTGGLTPLLYRQCGLRNRPDVTHSGHPYGVSQVDITPHHHFLCPVKGIRVPAWLSSRRHAVLAAASSHAWVYRALLPVGPEVLRSVTHPDLDRLRLTGGLAGRPRLAFGGPR
jgi:hypothetical protein